MENLEGKILNQLTELRAELVFIRKCVESQSKRLTALENIKESLLLKVVYLLGALSVSLIGFIMIALVETKDKL